ncbi:Hemolysin or related protein, contains CBS domains [Gulbenkiania indica]|uniref:Hemolysin or related protein, contains CBS domains n=1 Tax=Gulbenkiania indica TaxID=375574 RepID=A0A0K6GXB3_9NEIS|nr:hemolysin family protein [Gulbenkiania indica]CUA83133.1 Hemolysin or related protein, contains CBS domains [Gulbenkiania indica]
MDILILLLLILLNGLFAMSELAVVSSRKVRLQQWADDGHKGAQAALQLAEEPTRFLSTIQIGITSISILSGVFGEAAISEKLRNWLVQYPALADYSHVLSVVIMVITVTTLSLILGELVPKRLAMLNPELVAATMARPMRLLSRISSPLVRVLSLITDSILRLLGARKSKEPSITEEEIRVLMEQGADEGVFDRAEQELVENIFRLDDRKVASVMTPRKEIVALDIEDTLEENRSLLQESPYSRFPVCKGDMEHVMGILDAKRMLDRMLAGEPVDFTSNLEAPLYVPANVSLMQLLEQFKLSRTHLALVVDEYGELEGLVTMNDVLEAIVGDLPASGVPYDEEIVRRDDGSWLVDGMVTLDRFKEYFDLETLLPGEETGNINTLGGIMMFQLGRVPAVTDRFEWCGFTFEVMDMDKTRVDKIMVTRDDNWAPPAEEDEG